MLKIYIQDHTWAGCIVVCAENEEEARELMKSASGSYNYSPSEPVEELPIEKGLIHVNLGDS